LYEWLESEILEIKTPRFHVVDGPADDALKESIVVSGALVPVNYMEFVLKFGSAKLYRDGRRGSYRIGVFGAPRLVTLNDGSRIFHIGFDDGASVYVKDVGELTSIPIFQWKSGSEDKVADDFAEWIKQSCSKARREFSKEMWSKIVRGPDPFSPRELKVIEARRQISWQVLGIDPEGRHIVTVANSGRLTLPVLTVGVRSLDRRLNGALRLNTSEVGPGRTAVLHVSCYQGLLPPDQLELFTLPDPEPEDRMQYVELAETM
jgi:hypothetical protein